MIRNICCDYTYKQDLIIREKYLKICKGCGVRFYFNAIRNDKIICPNCYKYIFRNDRIEFKYRLMELLNRNALNI